MSGRWKLNRKMVLEAPVATPDGAGGVTTSWQALGTHWCALQPGAGREGDVGELPVSSQRWRIVLRAVGQTAASRPRPEQRFREGTRIFAIQSVGEADGAARFLLCHAIEEVAL